MIKGECDIEAARSSSVSTNHEQQIPLLKVCKLYTKPHRHYIIRKQPILNSPSKYYRLDTFLKSKGFNCHKIISLIRNSELDAIVKHYKMTEVSRQTS
jgi:hypothetical protein